MRKAIAGAMIALLAVSTIAIAAPASAKNGNKNHKITICHKPSWNTIQIGSIDDEEYEALLAQAPNQNSNAGGNGNGNGKSGSGAGPDGTGVEINVAVASLKAHLAHGDYAGECGANFNVKSTTALIGATSQLMGPYDHTGAPMKPESQGGSLTRTVNGTQTHVGEAISELSDMGEAMSERLRTSEEATLVSYPNASEAYVYGVNNENGFSMTIEDIDVSDHGRYYHDLDRTTVPIYYKQFTWTHERMLEDYPAMTEDPNYFHGLTPYPVQIIAIGDHKWDESLDRFKLICASEGEAVSMVNVLDLGLSSDPMDGNWNDNTYTYTFSCSDQDGEEERLFDTIVCDINGDYTELLLQGGRRAAPINGFSGSGVAEESETQFSAISDGEARFFAHESPIFNIGQGAYAGMRITEVPGADIAYERQFLMDPNSSPLLLSGFDKADANDQNQPYGTFIREPGPTQEWDPQLDDGVNINASFDTWVLLTDVQLLQQRALWLRAFTPSTVDKSMMITPLTKATVSVPLTTEYLTGINISAAGPANYEFESGDIVMREAYICPSETINIGWTRIS